MEIGSCNTKQLALNSNHQATNWLKNGSTSVIISRA